MVPPRITWAAGLLDPDPAARLLEAGCGPGVAASLICPRLSTGHLLAVDRSATAVARTAQRNAAHIAAGRLTVRRADLAELAGLGETGLDAAFTVDVNVFWTEPAGPAVGVLARTLRPGGRLLILYGAGGPTGTGRILGPIAAAMTGAGLTGVEELDEPDGFGVVARRTGRP